MSVAPTPVKQADVALPPERRPPARRTSVPGFSMVGRVTPCAPLPRSLCSQYSKTPALHLPIGSKLRLVLCLGDSAVTLHRSTLIPQNPQPCQKREINHLRRLKRAKVGKAASTDRLLPTFSHFRPAFRPPSPASGERDRPGRSSRRLADCS